MEREPNGPEPIWIDGSIVRPLHADLIRDFGGRPGLRDEGLLESALHRPRQLHIYGERSIAALASAYAFGVIRNHPFIDGNKRVSLVLAKLFLALNGEELHATQAELVATWLALAEGDLSEASLTAWIEARRRPIR